MALARASQERSPAIDHQMLRPVHTTRPIAAAAATMPARSRRGSAMRPRDQPTTSAAATRIAAVPSDAVASVPEAPPAKKAQATSTATAARTTATRPDRFARWGRVHGGPRYHRTVSVQRCQDLQFVYPALTTGSMPAGRLATLLGNPGTPPAPHRDSIPYPHRALRFGLAAHRTRDGRWRHWQQAGDGEGEELRRSGDRRLVRRRPRRQDLPAPVLHGGDREAPPDILDYSNAKEEIARALAFAKQGKPDPGGSDPSPGSTATTATETTTTEPARRPQDDDRKTDDDDLDADDGRHRHDSDGRAYDGHLGTVFGADAATRARRPCGAAPRSRLGRIPPPPHEGGKTVTAAALRLRHHPPPNPAAR